MWFTSSEAGIWLEDHSGSCFVDFKSFVSIFLGFRNERSRQSKHHHDLDSSMLLLSMKSAPTDTSSMLIHWQLHIGMRIHTDFVAFSSESSNILTVPASCSMAALVIRSNAEFNHNLNKCCSVISFIGCHWSLLYSAAQARLRKT